MNTELLTRKRKQLQALRPLPRAVTADLDRWFRVELTYTSNAIEGNTLTRAETAVILEHGIAVGGKPLRDQMEAANHAAALDWMRNLVRHRRRIEEKTILEIHRLILRGIDDANAGIYRTVGVRIAGSAAIMPKPAKVPHLMAQFCTWLASKPKLHPAAFAAEAHYRLVTIHPFTDGNGRTARLLMNLILMQAGYPPALIGPRERLAYIRALEQAQLGGSIDDYENIIVKAIGHSLDIYLKAARGGEDTGLPMPVRRGPLLTIGQLAKRTGETNATLRFWLKEGLIAAAQRTGKGYHLFAPDMAERVKCIRAFQQRRFSLAEIREKL